MRLFSSSSFSENKGFICCSFLLLLQQTVSRDTPESDNDNDATCAELKQDEGWRSAQDNNNHVNGATMNNTFSNSSFNSMNNNSNNRPTSLCSEPEIRWVDLISVPLMMAYVTRYIYGTDKLRTNAFEVRGLNASSTGVIHLDDLAILSSWLKYITDNIVGLTNLQVQKTKKLLLFITQPSANRIVIFLF